MPIRQKVFAVLAAAALFFLIIELARRKKLRADFSYLWILTGAGVVVLAVWYDLLVRLTRLIGAVLPTTTLFLFALLFLAVICLYLSARLSALTDRLEILAQEIALLRGRQESPPGN